MKWENTAEARENSIFQGEERCYFSLDVQDTKINMNVEKKPSALLRIRQRLGEIRLLVESIQCLNLSGAGEEPNNIGVLVLSIIY